MAWQGKTNDMMARYLPPSPRVNSSSIKLFKPSSEWWVPKMLNSSIQLSLKCSVKIKAFKNMIIFHSQEVFFSLCTFLYVSLKTQLKTLGKQTQESFKGGGRKADRLGILEPKEQHNNEFLGFSFCLIYPRLIAGKVNLEMPISAVRKKSQETPTLSS